MEAYKNYQVWLESEYFDEEIKNELINIKDNREEIEDRFYKELEFGTAGLRGIIGAGTNRMNKYVIRKVSQGIADYINSKSNSAEDKGEVRVVIAYDSRYKSPEFAIEAAQVFAGNGIKTYLFDELRPVPVLSFSIRYLEAAGGIAITASHNPKNYNGYKVYGEDGAQLLPDESDAALKFIENVKDFSQIKIMEMDKALQEGLITIIGKEIDDAYVEVLKSYCINPDLIKKEGDTFKIVYTPLNGSGNKFVRRILNEIGFKNVIVVKEQENPDPEFPTVKTPNPEDKSVFELALKIAKKENADLIIGTDPDSDRVGIKVKNRNGSYVFLTGNQIGCLMLEYILSQKSLKRALPNKGFIVKTIVSTKLANLIAEKYNIEVEEVLTGFKFIGEKIRVLDEFGDKKYLFGFEESYGYLIGTYARDKDAVSASMMIAEMGAYYKSKGMLLLDALEKLYEKYGYAAEDVVSFTLEGKEGLAKIKAIMQKLREDKNMAIGGYTIVSISDYLSGEKYNRLTGEKEKLFLPPSDVIYYELTDGSKLTGKTWFCIRPSGTEPKIKVYSETFGNNMKEAKDKLNDLKEKVLNILKSKI
ncbi:MAG: phospho-sugar mutase [Firmicutes bacterium]|nr:phospho-sugar mutase [Bacillota bacterium]